jgi:Glycosyl transferase family 2
VTAVSIVVNNHDYARFVGAAIESALAQTLECQVVVVDDGSTDDSLAVIERYAVDVEIVAKENGGQASAFNAGFARASGDAVVFLDADDLLDPETAARIAETFDARPELSKAHYRLRVIDAVGTPTGALVPPFALRLPDGDIRGAIGRFPDDLPYPPSSGNAFAAWALERLLPIPEDEYRILADVYLLNVVPLLGPVAALDVVGGSYRVHGANRHASGGLRLDRVRATVRVAHETHARISSLGASLAVPGFENGVALDRSLVFLTQRLVSRKLDPGQHPLPGDRAVPLAVRGATTAVRRSDLGRGLRLLYVVWFVSVALAPRPLAARLAQLLLHPERRGRASALVERLRGRP